MLEWYREPEVMRTYFPTGFHGYDVDGYPVMVERQGSLYVTWRSAGLRGRGWPARRVLRRRLAG